MNWQQLCADPVLQNLPYKLELNRHGEVIMNAMSIEHAFYVEKIQLLLNGLAPEGFCPPEFAIETRDGIRSPDVVWISRERALAVRGHVFSTMAPEICIEVMSEGNTLNQMLEKRDLYFAAGADEFWLCSMHGVMQFFDAHGERTCSARFPTFPSKIVLFE